MLTSLLQPINTDAGGSLSGDIHSTVRESLPNVARVAAELILQLPRTSSQQHQQQHQPASIDGAIDSMLAAAKVSASDHP